MVEINAGNGGGDISGNNGGIHSKRDSDKLDSKIGVIGHGELSDLKC